MSATGSWALFRLAARRDRIRWAAWCVLFVAMVAGTISSITSIYDTPHELAQFAETVRTNAALVALSAPAYGLETTGGRIVYEVAAAPVVLGLVSSFVVTRHLRAEEEHGRSELLRAAVTGRHAPLVAALGAAVALDVAVGIAVALTMIGQGLGVVGSVAYGAALAGAGISFAAIAAVTSQLFEHGRAANGAAGAALGVAFAARAIGDVGSGTLSWLSPIGWTQAVRPFAGERWWALALPVVFAAACGAAAVVLGERRDHGAGMFVGGAGAPTGSDRLTTPLGLALRLHRGSLIGWTVGIFSGGALFGVLGRDVEDLIADNPDVAELLSASGDVVDAYFALAFLILALLSAGFAVAAVLRARGEEVDGRAEPVLATGLGRLAWLGSHLLVALGGAVVLLVAAGAGAGLSHGLRSGEWSVVGSFVVASVAFTPAVWLLAGVATAVVGLLPRATIVVWVAFGYCLVAGWLGEVLQLPGWALAISPFDHVPQMPAAGWATTPLVVLAALAGLLVAAGAGGFRTRDLDLT